MKKISALMMCAAVILSLTIVAGAEKGGSPGIDVNDPYYSDALADGFSQREVIDNGEYRVVTSGFENGLVGEISDESHEFAAAKAAAVNEIQEIRERSIGNGALSNEDCVRIKELLNEFYPDASVETYLPSELIPANTGDRTLQTLNFPGDIQETMLWIGTAVRCFVFQLLARIL